MELYPNPVTCLYEIGGEEFSRRMEIQYKWQGCILRRSTWLSELCLFSFSNKYCQASL